jgi:hypothetical protein
MPGKHHEFSPSRLKHLSLCSGAYRLEMGKPNESSPAAEEGTALHLAVEHEKILDEFTEEQKDCIQQCLDYMKMLAPDAKWEKEVEVTILVGFDTLTQGTVDAVAVLDDLIIAIDWKFGRGKVDTPENNWQVKAYSCGLMQKYNKPVEFHIAQPRRNFFKGHRFELEELPTMVSAIDDVIDACKDTSTLELTPSEEACKWCRAKTCCPAVQDNIKNSSLTTIEHCSELSTKMIGEYLDKWREIKKVGASLENQARERLLAGEEIPGYAIQTYAGKQKVTNPQGVYDSIQDTLELNEFMECIDVRITPLLDKYARKRKEQEALAGHKMSLKQAKEELQEAIAAHVERGSDSKRLTRVGTP